MSGYRANELTLYLRPIDTQPPYQINNCAIWMVKNKYAANKAIADKQLAYLYKHNIWRYKSLLSAYYMDTDEAIHDYSTHKDVNKYATSSLKENDKANRYGDELHMYY